MCATCGCLTSGTPAPEKGTYECVECKEAGDRYEVTMEKGESMPKCPTCAEEKVHWVKA